MSDSLTSQGNIAVKEAALENEAQYTGTAHLLFLPSCNWGGTNTLILSGNVTLD